MEGFCHDQATSWLLATQGLHGTGEPVWVICPWCLKNQKIPECPWGILSCEIYAVPGEQLVAEGKLDTGIAPK